MAEWKHAITVGICRLRSNSVFRFQLCFANFISVSSFRLWVSVPGSFLKIVCILQFRRSISSCGFSVSVNFKQFGSWVFQFCAIWGFNSVSVQFQVVSFCFCSISGSFLPWFGLGA